jgi:hypothetical protein
MHSSTLLGSTSKFQHNLKLEKKKVFTEVQCYVRWVIIFLDIIYDVKIDIDEDTVADVVANILI